MRGMAHSKTNQTSYRMGRRALNNWGKEKDRTKAHPRKRGKGK